MRVICINNKIIDPHNPYNDSLKRLEEGKTYNGIEDEYGILLEEVKSSHPHGGWNRNRFINCSDEDETKKIDKILETIFQSIKKQ